MHGRSSHYPQYACAYKKIHDHMTILNKLTFLHILHGWPIETDSIIYIIECQLGNIWSFLPRGICLFQKKKMHIFINLSHLDACRIQFRHVIKVKSFTRLFKQGMLVQVYLNYVYKNVILLPSVPKYVKLIGMKINDIYFLKKRQLPRDVCVRVRVLYGRQLSRGIYIGYSRFIQSATHPGHLRFNNIWCRHRCL